MFSLSIQIINLLFHEPYKHNQQQQIVTIRFGPLQSDIRLTGQNSYSGGKRLMLQMQQSQLYNLFSTYAFGIFIKNQLGKFWCILNIAQIKINQKYSCRDLIFYDDDRKNCYTFQLQLQLLNFNPALPKRTNKPAQPLANTTPNAVHSFLNNTNKNLNVNHRKNNQQQTNKKKFNKNKKQPKKDQNKINYGVIQHKNINNFINQEDSGIYIPPAMEFINQSNETSIIQSKQRQFNTKQDKFTPDNIIKQEMPKLKTFENYSQFKQQNKQKSKTKIQSKQIKRNELRQMAIKQAQKQMNKKSNQIMIPIPNPNTGTYELIPLSNLTEAQIMQYAQKQRKAQQYQKFKQQQLIKLKEKEEKKRKKQLENQFKKKIPNQIAKQNIGPKQKISHRQNISEKNKESSQELQGSQSVIQSQKDQMQDDKQQNSYEADEQVYESDFESVSNAGSQLKSRLSLQSSRSMSQQKKKNNYQDASESLDEYGYSQDFDSFSQSLLSKNKKGVNSISEISQSYLSMSNRK